MPTNATRLLSPALGLALAASVSAQQPPVTLKVGDPAPPLTVRQWVKGTPVTTLGHGTVNVVEFWATWCGPCKESIPHLTQLAHKYKGKATFTGVDVFEVPDPKDESYLAAVSSFVKTMGEKMDYHVAADGKSGVMGKSWMEAAGQDGIPTAFIVDQQGRVAWIGHPMFGLDEAVGKVISGTFDLKAEAAKEAAATAEEAKQEAAAAAQQAKAAADSSKQDAARQVLQADAKPLADAVQAQKFDVAAVEAGKLMIKHPEFAEQLAIAKFEFLMQSDEKAGYAYAKEAAATVLKNKEEALNEIAWSIIDEKTPIKHRDYATALVIAQQAAEVGKMKNPFSLDTYANALLKVGDAKGALTVETNAVNIALKMGPTFPAKPLADMKEHLAKMKALATAH